MALLFFLICCVFAFILREKAAVWCRFVTFSLFLEQKSRKNYVFYVFLY